MKIIKVSDATYRAIAEATIGVFRSTGTRQPDGTWLVPIEDDTWERIEKIRLAGESDDDTIQRAIHISHGRPLN